jgi:hypothetical protein
MITHFGPDHLCPDCEDVAIYWWVGTRGETRCMEVDHCRPHMCPAAESRQQAAISRTRCPDCRLSVYRYQEELYDEDAALVRHQCAASVPPTPPAPPQTTPSQVTVIRSIATTLVQIPRLADHE